MSSLLPWIADLKVFGLDGGPCSGKSTALNYLYEKFSNSGYSVVTVPEVPTLIINSGLSPEYLLKNGLRTQYFKFEHQIFKGQRLFEEQIFGPVLQAKNGKKNLLITDGSLFRIRAYVTDSEFNNILGLEELNVADLIERYDAMYHMVTAADGKPEFYTTENNSARYETLQEALKADQRTQNALLLHPKVRIIDNSTFFEEKLKRLRGAMQRDLGDPIIIEDERKFRVLSNINDSDIPVPYEQSIIEQAYFPMEGNVESRIRKRVHRGSSLYYRTYKTATNSPGKRPEKESQISKSEFDKLFYFRDPTHDVIQKIRTCFIYRYQYFELDRFIKPARLYGRLDLELELTEENPKINIPSWLGKVKEVTNDPNESNYNLSKIP